jgi:hypothetical protein
MLILTENVPTYSHDHDDDNNNNNNNKAITAGKRQVYWLQNGREKISELCDKHP